MLLVSLAEQFLSLCMVGAFLGANCTYFGSGWQSSFCRNSIMGALLGANCHTFSELGRAVCDRFDEVSTNIHMHG